jgi:two-component system, LytTR family, response regulator LytT
MNLTLLKRNPIMLSVLLVIQDIEMRNALVEQINKSNPKYEIAGITKGVKESIKWHSIWGPPDLIVSAQQFTDGSCYDIIQQCNLFCPVFFLPTSDSPFDYDPAESNTTMCITEPSRLSKIVRGLAKFQSDRHQLMTEDNGMFSIQNEHKGNKTRIIIKKGKEFHPINLTDVVAIYFQNGIVFVLTSDNKKSIVDADGLNQVYINLDRSVFYRANRKYIFNVNYLSSYKSIGNNRILIELNIRIPEDIIISQYRSNEFRAWIEDLSINSGNTTSK